MCAFSADRVGDRSALVDDGNVSGAVVAAVFAAVLSVPVVVVLSRQPQEDQRVSQANKQTKKISGEKKSFFFLSLAD